MKHFRIIGVTGGVGSGKTFVVSRARELYQIPVILADEVGHIALLPGQKTYDKVIEAFGTEILKEDGTIDRKRLGAIVFAEEKKRTILNQIVHPFITEYIKNQINEYRISQPSGVVLLEAAILLESELAGLCDEIWFVSANQEIRRERLKSSRGYTDEKIDQMMDAQLSDDEIKKQVDQILLNNGNLEEIDRQLKLLLD